MVRSSGMQGNRRICIHLPTCGSFGLPGKSRYRLAGSSTSKTSLELRLLHPFFCSTPFTRTNFLLLLLAKRSWFFHVGAAFFFDSFCFFAIIFF
ncbi:hypothetical protein M441DRAFT_414321 [Trichoderma asperellum CBS 433.97]|uniref:Transmembrane protein n=1 Tax=Trichoderma asperellum (strain ATCC 204424 / CBS 433.97 / NBRC 101777) TaxID=1042311 RepID=A0A2T3Z7U5_TRIA4|nr:hypothetical protein M441DRAFT_414321 [Trichoderma asperellum CBS 433.97]PTB40893.1 hypothetical protein M441DRAFT_414321 [Trichoderma asperellum CBS 433.97]